MWHCKNVNCKATQRDKYSISKYNILVKGSNIQDNTAWCMEYCTNLSNSIFIGQSLSESVKFVMCHYKFTVEHHKKNLFDSNESPFARRAEQPHPKNILCHISPYIWPLLTLSIGSLLRWLKGKKGLFITDKQKTGIVKRQGKQQERGRRINRVKPGKKRKKTEKQEEVGLAGDAPLPGWQT